MRAAKRGRRADEQASGRRPRRVRGPVCRRLRQRLARSRFRCCVGRLAAGVDAGRGARRLRYRRRLVRRHRARPNSAGLEPDRAVDMAALRAVDGLHFAPAVRFLQQGQALIDPPARTHLGGGRRGGAQIHAAGRHVACVRGLFGPRRQRTQSREQRTGCCRDMARAFRSHHVASSFRACQFRGAVRLRAMPRATLRAEPVAKRVVVHSVVGRLAPQPGQRPELEVSATYVHRFKQPRGVNFG
jgi:hypothetical protein